MPEIILAVEHPVATGIPSGCLGEQRGRHGDQQQRARKFHEGKLPSLYKENTVLRGKLRRMRKTVAGDPKTGRLGGGEEEKAGVNGDSGRFSEETT